MSKNDNTPENSEFSFVPREEGAESGVEAGVEDLKAVADEVVKPPAK